jgi:DNA-binding CsgD family transcriptional regulator
MASSIDPAILETLHRTQFGIIFTSADARPAFANVYAQRLLEDRDGLSITDQGLEALAAADTRLLRTLIARSANRELRSCATLQLPRERRVRPLIVYLPVHGHVGTSARAVTLFVCDPHHEPAVDGSLFSRLFGFTRAEATLAGFLMRGLTVEQAAETLFVSEHTVRTHLKRMLLKTDTGRQAELLRLLLTCSAHVRLD